MNCIFNIKIHNKSVSDVEMIIFVYQIFSYVIVYLFFERNRTYFGESIVNLYVKNRTNFNKITIKQDIQCDRIISEITLGILLCDKKCIFKYINVFSYFFKI